MRKFSGRSPLLLKSYRSILAIDDVEYQQWTGDEQRAVPIALTNLSQLLRLEIPPETEWIGDKNGPQRW